MFENINYGKGVSKKYIDFDVNKDIPLEYQLDLLKEDLLQIIYDNDYIIYMGWYPEFDESGDFRVSIIKDYHWDNPVFQKSCRDLELLNEFIHECINLIESKRKAIEVARNLLDSLNDETIAETTGLDIEEIRKLRIKKAEYNKCNVRKCD